MTDKMLSPHLLEFLATLKDELVNLNNQAERLYFLEILMEQVVETLERNAQTGADKERAEMVRRQFEAFQEELALSFKDAT
jgi:hypothetical protein